MFTGIIETIGNVRSIEKIDSNIQFEIEADIANELKVDQSVAHNGCCLTVVSIEDDSYKVVAIEETLNKTNLGQLEVNDKVNLERCMVMNGRLDGHIVQGHVDTTATCTDIAERDGSHVFTFNYTSDNVTVEKGSITVNGVSLTVVDSKKGQFSVHIIPYTFENTNFCNIQKGDRVNIEFDIIGKYVERLMNAKL